MITICKQVSISLNPIFKRLSISAKIRKLFSVNLDQILQEKLSGPLADGIGEEFMGDVTSRLNQNLIYWFDKKKNDILIPIISNFGKKLGISENV
jgi:hypothetical protein